MSSRPLTLMLIAVLVASVVLAQEAAPLTGTITFRGGATLTGIIKTADLGIMGGAGVGTSLPGYGGIKINVGGQGQLIPATQIVTIEATWVDKSQPGEPAWEISELRVTTTDGKVLVGKPDWHMHYTNVSLQLPSGEIKRVHAFPLGGSDFKPENLIAKIELGGAAPAPAPTATVTPAPTTPAPTTPATTAPATATPTPTTPATTAPATATPTPTTPATTAPAAATATPAVTAAPAGPPTTVTPGQPVVIKVLIPGTNKEVSILLYVSVTEKGIEIMPPQ